MTVDEVFELIVKDKSFYDNSGGGVTFSGGEPLLWSDFLAELSAKCVENGIKVGFQTACNVPYSAFEKVMPYADFFMCDLKAFDEQTHKKYIGVSGMLIKENLQKLSRENVKLIVRTPVVTGVNDSVEEIGNICGFIKDFPNLDYYELLRYHPFGLGKLEQLNMDDRMRFDVPSDETMLSLKQKASEYILKVKCSACEE